jgi:hypothetical protein
MDAWNLIILLGVSAIWVGFVTAMVWLVAVAQPGR